MVELTESLCFEASAFRVTLVLQRSLFLLVTGFVAVDAHKSCKYHQTYFTMVKLAFWRNPLD